MTNFSICTHDTLMHTIDTASFIILKHNTDSEMKINDDVNFSQL